jgi:glyoxylase-like metal-dependent hydrolase (beta-lactamase superfamily II)
MTVSPLEVTGLLQREAWAQSRLPPVERLRPDLWSIPVPMPNGPLRYVSVYVLGSESSLTLVDAGWDSDESWQALLDGLAGIGASIADVHGVLVTHQHLDHIGLARRVRAACDAWIALHPADGDAVARPEFREPPVANPAEARWLVSLGASPAEAHRLTSDRPQPDPRSTVAIPDRLVVDGEYVRVPGWKLRAIHTPGHTPGHLCFVDEHTRLFFSGDHVLPRISPNISAEHDMRADALADFLASLDKIRDLDVDEVLPAHEWRFRGLPQRVDGLHAHHAARLDELLEAVRRKPGSVPWDLAGELTWSRTWDQYDGFMRLSAVGETMAHLVYLVHQGLVAGSDEAVPRYTAIQP